MKHQTSLDHVAKKYAPILCYHPDEEFFVSNVEAFLDHANFVHPFYYAVMSRDKNLSQNIPEGDEYAFVAIDLSPNVGKPKPTEFSEEYEVEYVRQLYRDVILPDPGRYPKTVYYHIRDEAQERYAYVTYWFFYVFNDFANNHQGDWEGIILELERKADEYAISRVGASAHIMSFYLPWDKVRKNKSADKPIIFIGRGSHGSYFSTGNWSWYLVERIGGMIDPDRALVKKIWDGMVLFWNALKEYFRKPREGHPLTVVAKADEYICIIDRDCDINRVSEIKQRTLEHYDLVKIDPPEPNWLRFQGEWGHRATPYSTWKKLQYVFDRFGEKGPRGPKFKIRWNDPEQWFEWALPYTVLQRWGLREAIRMALRLIEARVKRWLYAR